MADGWADGHECQSMVCDIWPLLCHSVWFGLGQSEGLVRQLSRPCSFLTMAFYVRRRRIKHSCLAQVFAPPLGQHRRSGLAAVLAGCRALGRRLPGVRRHRQYSNDLTARRASPVVPIVLTHAVLAHSQRQSDNDLPSTGVPRNLDYSPSSTFASMPLTSAFLLVPLVAQRKRRINSEIIGAPSFGSLFGGADLVHLEPSGLTMRLEHPWQVPPVRSPCVVACSGQNWAFGR